MGNKSVKANNAEILTIKSTLTTCTEDLYSKIKKQEETIKRMEKKESIYRWWRR